MDKKSIRIRVVVQQCLSAALRISESESVAIDSGMIIFVCFLKGDPEELEAKVKSAVEVLAGVKLCEAAEAADPAATSGKGRLSVSDALGEVLVVPQATLGGKLKGKSLQYHGNVDKRQGEEMFLLFCQELGKCLKDGVTVKRGIYGARQVLSMNTNGPYTHVLEF